MQYSWAHVQATSVVPYGARTSQSKMTREGDFRPHFPVANAFSSVHRGADFVLVTSQIGLDCKFHSWVNR